MAWCDQATSYCLSQCWPSSLWPYGITSQWVNALRQKGQHCAKGIFNHIFLNNNYCILIFILLKFVPKCPVDDKSAWVQIMFSHQNVTGQYLSQCWYGSLIPSVIAIGLNEFRNIWHHVYWYFRILCTHIKGFNFNVMFLPYSISVNQNIAEYWNSHLVNIRWKGFQMFLTDESRNQWAYAMQQKCHRFYEIFIIRCTRICHFKLTILIEVNHFW